MSSDIKIIRLPNDINPDVLVRKTIKEKYAVCPYCGNKDYRDRLTLFNEGRGKGVICVDEKVWYGYPDGKFGLDWNGLIYTIKHMKERMNWKKYTYHCYKCGCGWESKPFPDEILTKEEVSEMGGLLNKKEEHI